MIYGSNSTGIRKLAKGLTVTDNTRHKKGIKTACYAKEIRRIFTLDSMSDHLRVYDMGLSQVGVIRPNANCKTVRDITSFTFSNRQLRIGAVMKDYSLSFWDASDNFGYEMSFSISGFCQNSAESIYYLEEMDMWLTTDRSSSICVWNIATEELDHEVRLPGGHVAAVCEVAYLMVLAVGVYHRAEGRGVQKEHIERSEVLLWSEIDRKVLVSIEMPNHRAGLHSVLFFRDYQVLLTLGYENKINCF